MTNIQRKNDELSKEIKFYSIKNNNICKRINTKEVHIYIKTAQKMNVFLEYVILKQ